MLLVFDSPLRHFLFLLTIIIIISVTIVNIVRIMTITHSVVAAMSVVLSSALMDDIVCLGVNVEAVMADDSIISPIVLAAPLMSMLPSMTIEVISGTQTVSSKQNITFTRDGVGSWKNSIPPAASYDGVEIIILLFSCSIVSFWESLGLQSSSVSTNR